MHKLTCYLPPSHLTALVGAGGKTSILYALATGWAACGETVLCTTTTKLLYPDPGQCHDLLLLKTGNTLETLVEAIQRRLKASQVLLATLEPNPETDQPALKLRGFAPETVDALARALPRVCLLVEADGAAHRPLKAPAAHEPVIPTAATRVVGVMGVDALGKPLAAETVHRPDRLTALLDAHPDEHLTPDHLARLATHPEGLFKNSPPDAERWLVLNKADDAEQREAARRVARRAVELGFAGRILFGSARQDAWTYAPTLSGA